MISLFPPISRRYVNLIISTTNPDDNTHHTYNETYVETLGIRFCKRCNFAVVWREDLNNVFCPNCTWQPLKKQKEKTKAKSQDDDI
jgi:hypothetical protein